MTSFNSKKYVPFDRPSYSITVVSVERAIARASPRDSSSVIRWIFPDFGYKGGQKPDLWTFLCSKFDKLQCQVGVSGDPRTAAATKYPFCAPILHIWCDGLDTINMHPKYRKYR